MQAAATRIAGRHLAGERGAFERERDPEPPVGAESDPSTAPLREFLSDESWSEVLKLLVRLQRAA